MMAILSTASMNQARVLRDTFYRHLAFEGFIGAIFQVRIDFSSIFYPALISMQPNGYPTFHLAFDLPFYALRMGPPHRPPQDLRGIGDTGPLRQVTDLSFLLRGPNRSDPPLQVDYLCQAQVSVLITGPDPWRWVAYCFVDTYFEHETRRESAESYHDEIVVDEADASVVFQPDPFTLGERDACCPILTPREYFLVALEPRLRHVRDEWHVLVTKLRQIIDRYVSILAPRQSPLLFPSLSELGLPNINPTNRSTLVILQRHIQYLQVPTIRLQQGNPSNGLH